MAKVLILSASTGGGHKQVAKALMMELAKYSHQVIEVEPFKEKSKMLDMIISDGYKMLIKRLPTVYGSVYKFTNNEVVNEKVLKATNKTLCKMLVEIYEEHKPDIIITTHPFFNHVLSTLKNQNVLDVPLVSMVTDFIPHRCYISPLIDAYVVGSGYTKDSLVTRGVQEDKVYIYGIPVKRDFFNKTDKGNRIKKDFTILIMGGSMGVKGVKSAVKAILKNIDKVNLLVVCGNNKLLKRYLEEKYMTVIEEGKLKVFGFTKDVPKLMDNCDVIITKPGGLTCSEAIVKNIPMIIPYYIPGQEEENAEFLEEKGAALLVKKISQLDDVILNLLDHPEKLNRMKELSKELAREQSLDDVIELINELVPSFYY